ncbi:MAG: HlyD family type I secretion periplasmic adaptor subunit [Rhodospirillales bacterium]|jgi:HlyD family secretion protein|nr:HlyD family type I secretion periplasmic adaptor subunit [Rhodospirillales bacterium]|tara:strand:+ start:2200 stop:3927 length:1728 start_codon:yes stop_codon:yes gene_type:complete
MTAAQKSIPRGEYIFREGETGGFAYVLNEGAVEIVKSGDEGTVVLSEVTPGALFGEMAIIDGGSRSASARARTDAVVTEVDKNTFLSHISKNPETTLSLMKRLSSYVRSANLRSAESLLSVPGRGKSDAAELAYSPNAAGAISEDIDDTDAVYDARPARLMMMVCGAVLAFIITGVLFVSLSFIDTTVSVRGKLTTKVPNIEIQATSNAVIEALLVQRGQFVAKDEIIARLDGTYIVANRNVARKKLAAVDQRIVRLEAERYLSDTQEAVPRGLDLNPANLDILTKRLDEYRSRIRAFAARLSKLDQDIGSAESTIEITRKQLESKKRIEGVRKHLYDQEIGSLLNYLMATDDSLSAVRRHNEAIDGKKKLATELSAINAERQAFVAQWAAGLSDRLAMEEEVHFQLSEELVKLERQSEDLIIRSPVDGTILDLPTISEGSIVREGEPIMTLVRANVAIALEVDIDPKDVSDVKIGSPVKIKLDALPFQKFGDLPGVLAFISSDTIAESLDGEEGAFYRGRVEIKEAALNLLPEGFQLTPGMLASADLKVSERRLVTYFTYPITKNFSQAFREPD